MDFKEYQIIAKSTATYAKQTPNWLYSILGLPGEVGEICEKLKKLVHKDPSGYIPDVLKEEIKKEIGDALWYLADLCSQLGISFEDVAQTNVAKLKKRFEEGKILGKGDNR